MTAQAITRLKNDPDKILWADASAKAKVAGMSATALLRALLRGYRDGKIEIAVPKVLVNEPEVIRDRDTGDEQ